MSTKLQTVGLNKNSQMRIRKSQKSQNTIFNEISKSHLNTSIDSEKNNNQTAQKSKNIDEKSQLSEKKELKNQQGQLLQKSIQVEQLQNKTKKIVQKLLKKHPEISQCPNNKQNLNLIQIKKSHPLSLHRPNNQHNEPIFLQKTRKLHLAEHNYSIVNGKKVYMSEEDVAKLKRLKLQYRKHEQQINKKIVAHDQMIEKAQTEVTILKDHKIEKEKQKRMNLIEKNQNILQKERLQKFQRFQKENKKLKQIKKSKKLFQKMQQQYNMLQQQQKNNVDELIRSRMGSGKVNFDEIKEHEKQYLDKKQQIIQNSRTKIQSKIQQPEDEFDHLNLHKSIFYENVKNQKQQIHQSIIENDRKRKVYSEKIQQYKQIVRENYMPKVIKAQPVKQKKMPTYSLSDLHNIGNQYMKEGVKLIDRSKSFVLLEKMKQQQEEKNSKKTYKNYLHQKKTESSPMIKPKSYSNLMNVQMDKQLKQINAQKNLKQKNQKIKILHNKIQMNLKSILPVAGKIKLRSARNQNTKQSQNQVNQIIAKLKILQQIENVSQL